MGYHTKQGRASRAVTLGLAALGLLSLIACALPSAAGQTGGSTPSVVNPQTEASAEPTQPPASPTSAAPQPLMKPGDYARQTIRVGSDNRLYILHVPKGYDGSQALPLVFILHGHGGSAAGMVKLTGMSDKADAEGFFVAYLNGTQGSDGQLGWNTGITPDLNITVDDVAFVRDLAHKLETQVWVDDSRIYVAGFSNGANMTHRLAAELPDLLAAVAAVEGTIGNQQPDGTFPTIPAASGPIPVLIVHGKKDPTVPYDGQRSAASGKGNAKSVADAVAFWTQADSCTGAPQETTSADGNIISEDYTGCAASSEVELLTIQSGVHEWPTLADHARFNGTDAIWDFLARHSKPGS